jgi:hypothetical protein
MVRQMKLPITTVSWDSQNRRLRQLASLLGVSVVVIQWPDWLDDVDGSYLQDADDARMELRGFTGVGIPTPVCTPAIILRGHDPEILAHELGHHAAFLCRLCPTWSESERSLSPSLNRAARRIGVDAYCRSCRSELHAELIGRRLLGDELTPTLRRFTARAWSELQRRSTTDPA